MAGGQFGAGKWPDGLAPLGPWLAPAPLVPGPDALELTTRDNGEVRQDRTTADTIFACRTLIACCSGTTTLRSGDVLSTSARGA